MMKVARVLGATLLCAFTVQLLRILCLKMVRVQIHSILLTQLNLNILWFQLIISGLKFWCCCEARKYNPSFNIKKIPKKTDGGGIPPKDNKHKAKFFLFSF